MILGARTLDTEIETYGQHNMLASARGLALSLLESLDYVDVAGGCGSLQLGEVPIAQLRRIRDLTEFNAGHSGRMAAGPVVNVVLLTGGADRMIHSPG